MKIAAGSDHAGFAGKEHLKGWLAERGHEVIDLGTHGPESVDYPDFAARVARAVAAGEAPFGLLLCGTGIGVSIAANKVRGIRAAHCTDPYQARLARQHNDANILCLGGRVSGLGLMEAILESFLSHGFDGGRHQVRVEKIRRLEPTESA
ncbi:MAG TPA: ribose 5-phosphate isomerase B [Candidatus Polarisedimenticolaceae bacterium]|nr:ribose 5-phosphate isomerase B [Candidatus Polarisedimenticolaceae bacterium]